MKIKEKLSALLRNMRFKNKLVLITAASVIVVGLVAVCGFQYSISKFNLLLYEQTAHSLRLVAGSIASELDAMAELSRSLAVTKALQEDLYTYNTMPEGFIRSTAIKNINKLLYRSVSENVIQLAVATPGGRVLYWGSDSSTEQPEVVARAKQLCDEAQGGHIWISTDRPDGSLLLCRQIRQIEGFSLDPLGYLAIRVDLKRIVTRATTAAEGFDYDFLVSVYDENNNIVYPTAAQNGLPAEMPFTAGYSIVNADGQRSFVVHTRLSQRMPGWRTALSVPYNDVFRSVVVSNALYLVFLAVAVAVLILASSIVVKNITLHFNELVQKMERLKAGNFELLPATRPNSNDELGLLNRYFDEMTVDFKKTIEDNYVKELLIAQAQLKSLEQQINPHFLYNTLQSINCLARKSSEDNIVVMVDALANLLRNSLNTAQDVITLRHELSIVNSYIQIQQIRFGDALQVKFEVDEEVLDFKIPKMTIQPLVENGIVHSMDEMVELCDINVKVLRRDGNIIISVENNGSEIDVDIIARLHAATVVPKGNGIGLCNIDARLKLIFGERYGLFFENTAEGVIVTAVMPEPPEEESACLK